MPYGIEIYNTSGETQVDGAYKNFSLHDSGTWNAPTNGGVESISFSPTSTAPIVAINPADGDLCNVTNYETDSNGDYNKVIGYAKDPGSYPSGIPFIVLTEAGVNEINGSYGLAIYDASGELVFHNFNKWCRLVSYQTVSQGSNVGVVNANNNYFILRPCCFGTRYNDFFDAQYRFSIGMKKVNSTTLNIDYFDFELAEVSYYNDFCPSSFKLIEIAI